MTSTTTEPLARALLLAIINCGHEIDSSRVLLHFDAKQEGHNALNQLSRRIEGVLQAQPAAAAPAIRWSPIETAPKDGSVILVDDNAGGSAPWAAAKFLAGEEWSGWIYEDDVMNDNQPLGPNPTRWLEGLDASVNVAKEQAPVRPPVSESPERLAELKAQLDLALQANADARRAGRAEALAILMGTSAEDFPEIYIGEHTVGEGDALSFHWREDALRTLLLLTGADPAGALIERVTDAWWSQEHTIDELRDRLRNGPRKIENLTEFFAEAKLLDLRASDLAPKLAARPEFAAEAAIARAGGAHGNRA